MNSRNNFIVIILMLCLVIMAYGYKKSDFPVLKGPYLVQKPAGNQRELFAPDIVSTGYNEHGVTFTPDESYLIFQSDRPGTYGEGDLFISYRLKNGKWSEPRNMGRGINTKESGEACPMVSTDGKYLFFSSMYRSLPNYSEPPITWQDKIRILNQPGHGSEDVFWVSARIIKDLKPEELKQTK